METLLRIHDSPLPTQMTFGFLGSMLIAPIDCTGSLSNTALNVVPPLVDFHTPPDAAPAYTVSRPASWTAATAATRPLIAAEPMLRAPKPEMVSESTFTGPGCCAAASTGRAASTQARAVLRSVVMRRVLELVRHGTRETRIVDGDVGLDPVVGDLAALRAALRAGFDRERQVPAVDLLVVAQNDGVVHFGAANHARDIDLNRDASVGIEVIDVGVGVSDRDLEFVDVGAVHLIHADELDFVALPLIVDERAVEVGVLEDRVQLFLAHCLGILLALPGLDLPAGPAVVGLDSGHALERELLTHRVGALVLLDDGRLESAATRELPAAAQGGHGRHAGQAARGLQVLGDKTVDGLGGERRGERRRREDHENSAHDCLPHRNRQHKDLVR